VLPIDVSHEVLIEKYESFLREFIAYFEEWYNYGLLLIQPNERRTSPNVYIPL